MNNLFKLEDKLKKCLLRNVQFTLNGKVLRGGKVRVFNSKQFFINFNLENDGNVKDFKVLYPYECEELENGFRFDYCLSAFCPRTEDVYWKMKMTNSDNCSKYHENYLYLTFT